MNIGVYVRSITNEEEVKCAIDSITHGFDTNILDDASIFYDSVGFTPFFFPCGLFNSTEIWSFKGKLVVFSIDCLQLASKIVNNIDIYYCFGFDKDRPNVLNLIDATKNAKIITKTKDNEREIYRLTGRKSSGSLDVNNLVDILMG